MERGGGLTGACGEHLVLLLWHINEFIEISSYHDDVYVHVDIQSKSVYTRCVDNERMPVPLSFPIKNEDRIFHSESVKIFLFQNE